MRIDSALHVKSKRELRQWEKKVAQQQAATEPLKVELSKKVLNELEAVNKRLDAFEKQFRAVSARVDKLWGKYFHD